jgi:hypothetical protein
MLIGEQEKEIQCRVLKRQQALEQRKRKISRRNRRSYAQTTERDNPQYKGLPKGRKLKGAQLITHAKLTELLDRQFPIDDVMSHPSSEVDGEWIEESEEEGEEEEGNDEALLDDQGEEEEGHEDLTALKTIVDGLWQASDVYKVEYDDLYELPADAQFDEVDLSDL